MHWNDTQWSIIPNINPGSSPSIFYSVGAISTNDVWAVGMTSYATVPLLEHWDGSQWTLFDAPLFAPGGSLFGVAGRSQDDVWAVGSYQSLHGAPMPLSVHWSG